jgi:FMN phosphatase YigB (HAD superfamily)
MPRHNRPVGAASTSLPSSRAWDARLRCSVPAEPVRWVILDLDGTLYPLSTGRLEYEETVRRGLADLAGLGYGYSAFVLGAGRVSVRHRSATALFQSLGVPREAWNAFRDRHFTEFVNPAPNPGLAQAVTRLTRVMPVALVTNSTSRYCGRALGRIGLRPGVFKAIVTADCGLRPKPFPDAFLAAAQCVERRLSAAFSVGDRWTLDVGPVVALGGGGVEVGGSEDVVAICCALSGGAPRETPGRTGCTPRPERGGVLA